MTDAIDFSALLKTGDRIAWTGVALEPIELLRLLGSQLETLPADMSALLNISLTDAIDAQRLAAHMHIKALGGSVTNRRFADFGALDVLPVNYGAMPELVASGGLAIDCVLTQFAPDGNNFNRSMMIDYLADAIPRARVVIAEVNDQLPSLFGDTHVDAADVDRTIQVSRPPIEVPSRPARALEKEVSAHVNRLISDGDTLEVGLGSLPDAVLEGLSGKRDLGLHSGTIGDRVAELVEAGIITNRLKPIDTGKCVTATMLGTSKVYRWAHRNPLVEMRSPRYTHDNATHALIPRFMAINSALEIDLTGQVNSETIGQAHIGVIGGQGDFMRGGIRSPGGRNIIVMESTARKGSLSRIVPRIESGIVTSARSDADVVVTEYGIAELHGRTVNERAQALIAIAHPDFRQELQSTAEQGLI
jgi:acetyl-CoA hydrolase